MLVVLRFDFRAGLMRAVLEFVFCLLSFRSEIERGFVLSVQEEKEKGFCGRGGFY